MIAAKHFYAYLPSAESDLEEVSRIRSRFESEGYQSTEVAPGCLVGCISHPAGSASHPSKPGVLHLLPGTEIHSRSAIGYLVEAESTHRLALETLRLFNFISIANDSLRLVSDPLSLLPYYTTSLSGGLLVCSSVRDMLAAVPMLNREVDDQAVFEFLSCGTAFGSRTLHKHIRVSSAGQVIRWNRRTGVEVDRSGRTHVPPADASVAVSVATDGICERIRESFSKVPPEGFLPLTGGFDSRLIACFAASLKLNPRMMTLGYSQHDEIRMAKAVAQTLGGKTTVFPPPHPDVLELVPHWVECQEGFADTHALFMANLLSFPEPEGTPLYHGFIGDTLSGGLLNAIPIDAARTPEEVAKGASAFFFTDLTTGAGESLHLTASVEKGAEDILADLEDNLAPHQAFTLWNLENLQRRRVGNQLLYLGQRFMPVPVFYFLPLMEFWLSMPRIALDHRGLLRQLFQRHFPQVATLPHSEHVPSMIPRTRPAATYLSGWLLRRYGNKVRRKLGADAEKLDAHSYIWALWHGTTPEQKKKQLEKLEETHSLLQSQLGWDAPFPTDSLLQSCASGAFKQKLLLRRMYLLGEYVKSLPEVVSVEPAAVTTYSR